MTLREKYDQAPHSPGVYLMKDKKGKILYVGKAKDLKKRLASYFVKKEQPDPKTAALLELVADFDLIITQSDQEAFILESNLIKAHAPKYNVILKDGKNYPLLRIDMNETYPSIQRVRKIQHDRALYFGPYSSSSSVNQTLKQIQKIFRLRKCRNTQFRNGPGPVSTFRSRPVWGSAATRCRKMNTSSGQGCRPFFEREIRPGHQKAQTEMTAHARDQAYEKAAQVRDTLFAIQRIMEKQVVVCPDKQDRDVMGLAWNRGRAVVTVMLVRSGRLVDTVHYALDLGFNEPIEALAAFVDNIMTKAGSVPASVLLSHAPPDMDRMGKS